MKKSQFRERESILERLNQRNEFNSIMRNMDFNVKRAQKGFTAHYLLNYQKSNYGTISSSYNKRHGINQRRIKPKKPQAKKTVSPKKQKAKYLTTFQTFERSLQDVQHIL